MAKSTGLNNSKVKPGQSFKKIKNVWYFPTKKGWLSIKELFTDPDFKNIIKIRRGTFQERVFYKNWDWELALITPAIDAKSRIHSMIRYKKKHNCYIKKRL
jgi:hypothetical protein